MIFPLNTTPMSPLFPLFFLLPPPHFGGPSCPHCRRSNRRSQLQEAASNVECTSFDTVSFHRLSHMSSVKKRMTDTSASALSAAGMKERSWPNLFTGSQSLSCMRPCPPVSLPPSHAPRSVLPVSWATLYSIETHLSVPCCVCRDTHTHSHTPLDPTSHSGYHPHVAFPMTAIPLFGLSTHHPHILTLFTLPHHLVPDSPKKRL